MRTVAFKKGLLVLSFPDRIAEDPIELEMRTHGTEWAVVAANPTERIFGQGTYQQSNGEVQVSGHEVQELPEWWRFGQPVAWRDRLEVAAFGRSNTVIPIGRD